MSDRLPLLPLFGGLIGLGAGLLIGSFLPSKPPSAPEIQSGLSNNAAVYFKAGAVSGATVERARPGLVPVEVVRQARSYYASIGPDPYLGAPTADQNIAKAEQILSQQRPAQRQAVTRTNAPATNAPPVPATNAAASTNEEPK